MMDEEEFASDTDDEDYRPSDGEAGSEEEASGEEEDVASLTTEAGEDVAKGPKRKKGKSKEQTAARKRKKCLVLEDDKSKDDTDSLNKDENEKTEGDEYNKQLQEEVVKEKEEKKNVDEKKKADDLWSSFMSDVGMKPKTAAKASPAATGRPASSLSTGGKPAATPTASLPGAQTKKETTVKITQAFDFAGETVHVTKEVDVNSKEAKQAQHILVPTGEASSSSNVSPSTAPTIKKPTGGLGSVLGKINNKNKISVLDKSKLDWDRFKQKEGLEDDLKTHNRGKDGFIERQQFLERADYRQFEQERDLRLKTSKR